MKKYLFFVLIFSLLLANATEVKARTINVGSCSFADVSSAINESNPGDIINIPAGTCVWNETLVIEEEITLTGSKASTTKIINEVPNGASGGYYEITISMNAKSIIKNIHFDVVPEFERIALYVNGDFNGFRISNSVFNNFEGHNIKTKGSVYGVIDNCTFNSGHEIIEINDSSDGSASWSQDIRDIMGTDQAVYIEDCIFNGPAGDAVDSNDGAKWVFRYNTSTGLQNILDFHGWCYHSAFGTRWVEIYENDMTYEDHVYWGPMTPRGGAGMIYNNTLHSNYNNGSIILENKRSTMTCSATDQPTCQDGEGYPCTGQIQQMYIWNNTKNNEVLPINIRDTNYNREHIQLGRDVFDREPSQDNDGFLYTPFTYPHPLRDENESEIIRADANQDSSINTTDALLTLRHSLGLSMSETSWQASATTGDTDCDGITSTTDALLTLRHTLGLDMSGTAWCENVN